MSKTTNILLSTVFVLFSFIIATYTSCDKDPCSNVICQNGGFCKVGKCECFTGYTGTNCETKIDPCKGINCQNGGNCVDGKCQCPDGYGGINCELDIISVLSKTWTADDKEVNGDLELNYSCTIKKGTTAKEVLMPGFSDYLFNRDVKGFVEGNKIIISKQSPDNNGQYIEGSGTYNNTTGTIEWTYSMSEPVIAYSITLKGTWK